MQEEKDLAELHDEVHERTRRVRVAEVRRLLQEVLDRYVGQESFVKATLPGTKLHVDIFLDLPKDVLQDGPL